jgi:hypothetical protein
VTASDLAPVETPHTGWPSTCSAADLERYTATRDRGVQWLTAQVAEDGTPAGAHLANSWWRAPWALAVGGAPEVAARMLGWIEREALTDEGDLRPGPYDAPSSTSRVYHLSPIAIVAWQLGRYDIASSVMTAMEKYTDPTSGGVYEHRDFRRDPLQDTLKTAQLGVSALVTGRRDVADGVASWLLRQYEDQPELPDRYYSSRRDGRLVTDFPDEEAFVRVVDFTSRQQAYFHPGIAAAFLSGYGAQTGHRAAQDRALDYLRITTGGGDVQFDDPTSVQICKFGWGAAMTYAATPKAELRPWVVRMAEWFTRRQQPDGSWAPSSFLTPSPGPLDFYWKTAEHVMEISYIVDALYSQPLDTP